MEPEANFFTEELCNPQPLQTEVLLRWWLLYLLLSLTDLFVLTWSKKGNEKKITRDQDLKEPAVGPGKVKNLREGVIRNGWYKPVFQRDGHVILRVVQRKIPEQTSIAMYASL